MKRASSLTLFVLLFAACQLLALQGVRMRTKSSAMDNFLTVGALSASWETTNGTSGGGQIYAAGVGQPSAGAWGSDWIGNAFGPDEYSQATITTSVPAGQIWYVGVRIKPRLPISSGLTGYYAGLNNGSGFYVIDRYDNGSLNSHLVSSTVAAVNDIVRLEARGNVMTLFVNGSSVQTMTDSTYPSGNCGFGLNVTTFATGFIGKWSAGTL